MKKILSLAVILALAASLGHAAEKKDGKNVKTVKKTAKTAPSGPDTSYWSFQVQGDVNFMMQDSTNWASPTTFMLGFGAEVQVNFHFDRNLSVGLMTGTHSADFADPDDMGLGGGDWSYSATEIVGRYAFEGGDGIRPYIQLGVGISVNRFQFTPMSGGYSFGFNEGGLILSPGFGVALPLSDRTDLFFQARVDFTPLSEDLKTLPVPGMSDALFIPVQMGFNFHSL